jgi:hypothetical protein
LSTDLTLEEDPYLDESETVYWEFDVTDIPVDPAASSCTLTRTSDMYSQDYDLACWGRWCWFYYAEGDLPPGVYDMVCHIQDTEGNSTENNAVPHEVKVPGLEGPSYTSNWSPVEDDPYVLQDEQIYWVVTNETGIDASQSSCDYTNSDGSISDNLTVDCFMIWCWFYFPASTLPEDQYTLDCTLQENAGTSFPSVFDLNVGTAPE